jgi:hypothetical protein
MDAKIYAKFRPAVATVVSKKEEPDKYFILPAVFLFVLKKEFSFILDKLDYN